MLCCRQPCLRAPTQLYRWEYSNAPLRLLPRQLGVAVHSELACAVGYTCYRAALSSSALGHSAALCWVGSVAVLCVVCCMLLRRGCMPQVVLSGRAFACCLHDGMAQAALALIHPFEWHHIFIPVASASASASVAA